MIAGTKVHALRYAAMRADGNLGEIVNPEIFAQPRVLADFQIPGELHTQAGFYMHAFSDFCAEKPKQPSAERRRRDEVRSQEWQGHKVPQGLNENRRPPNEFGVIGMAEIYGQ